MNRPPLVVDDRLAFAASIPSERYFGAEFLSEENARIFSRTWQLAGRAEQVSAPGTYFTVQIGDEPVVVVRGSDGNLRAFSNVCRHRAGPVAEGEGKCSVFTCGYHGWSYGLDGRLIGTREFDGVERFDKADFGLPEFRVETWEGLVFVNCDPNAVPFDEVLDDLPERVAEFDLPSMRFVARKDWYVECNWKVYVDNYLEGYHIPVVHPSLNREIDYSRYRTETKRWYSIQHSPVKNTQRIRLSDDAARNRTLFFWVFPNLMINVYPDNFSTNLIVPLGPERTLTVFEWYFPNPESSESREKLKQTIDFSDEIQIEDIKICEAVQKGLRSRTYSTGRFSVKRENGVHHFHRLLAEFCNNE